MGERERGGGWLPPEEAARAGEKPPPAGQGAPGGDPRATGAPRPPAGQPPPGQPPPAYAPSPYPPGPYAAAPGPIQPEPGNGDAIAGLVLGICSVVFVVFSAGFSSVISLICGVLGIIFGRRGKSNVDSGATRRHRGLAQAGFVTGIVGAALSVIGTAFWVILFIVADDLEQDLDRDFQQEIDQSSAAGALARAAAAGTRLLIG